MIYVFVFGPPVGLIVRAHCSHFTVFEIIGSDAEVRTKNEVNKSKNFFFLASLPHGKVACVAKTSTGGISNYGKSACVAKTSAGGISFTEISLCGIATDEGRPTEKETI